MTQASFIVDCSYCKAKVAAEVSGVAENTGHDWDTSEPYGERLFIGKCPVCKTLLAGKSVQTAFEESGAEFDIWSDVVRIFPEPPRTFYSHRIPRIVTDSLVEADRSLQAGAHTAACVMFGRALEAVCRNMLEPAQKNAAQDNPPQTGSATLSEKKVMLAKGILELKNRNLIDQRLYDWSQQLHAFRNIAAHPDEISISPQDAEDLQVFVYAIVEYIYDLADRYEDFKRRLDRRNKRQQKRADGSNKVVGPKESL